LLALLIQSIAEGVEMLRRSDYDLNIPGLFVNWNNGSVIRSWLVELMGNAIAQNDGRPGRSCPPTSRTPTR
jgi:6-phosphogluconate dehydrogenase